MAMALEDTQADQHRGAPRSRGLNRYKRKDSLEFRVILWASFAAFFVAALLERVLPSHWVHHADGEQPRSVVAQAWHAANTCAAYALMG